MAQIQAFNIQVRGYTTKHIERVKDYCSQTKVKKGQTSLQTNTTTSIFYNKPNSTLLALDRWLSQHNIFSIFINFSMIENKTLSPVVIKEPYAYIPINCVYFILIRNQMSYPISIYNHVTV